MLVFRAIGMRRDLESEEGTWAHTTVGGSSTESICHAREENSEGREQRNDNGLTCVGLLLLLEWRSADGCGGQIDEIH